VLVDSQHRPQGRAYERRSENARADDLQHRTSADDKVREKRGQHRNKDEQWRTVIRRPEQNRQERDHDGCAPKAAPTSRAAITRHDPSLNRSLGAENASSRAPDNDRSDFAAGLAATPSNYCPTARVHLRNRQLRDDR
jgi:hypothetical protein